MPEVSTASRRSIAVELAVVTAAVLLVARLLFMLRMSPVIGRAVSTLVAVTLLYAPVAVLWARRRPIDFLDRGWRAYGRSLAYFAVVALIVFPPFLLCAHGWQVWIAKMKWSQLAVYPGIVNAALFQLLLVALPEEFFFRGYFQSAMALIFPKPWRVLGANLGLGWIVTALVFAIAHTAVTFRWWHFSIFFPALLFGWLRERTGSITAPVLFHAASNILMDWFARCYA